MELDKQSWEEFKKLDLTPKQQNAVLDWHNEQRQQLAKRIEGEKKTAANREYDGNDLVAAGRAYGIGAISWEEIIRFEDGFNDGLQAALSIVLGEEKHE